MARAQEIEATTSTYGGIDLEEAKKAMQEEDKFDKEIFRQRIKAKHREERLKAKAERRHQSNQEEEVDDEEDGGDSEGEGSLDGSVASIIDALPDPDRIYGTKEDDDDDEMNFQRGPAPPKYFNTFLFYVLQLFFYFYIFLINRNRSQIFTDSEDEDSEDDGDKDVQEVYKGPKAPRFFFFKS